VTYEIISKETEDTPNFAEEGSFITALSDVVTNAIETVQNFDKENEHGPFNSYVCNESRKLPFLTINYVRL
jgi:hypothetical protein